MRIKVKGQFLQVVSPYEKFIADSINQYYAEFEFSEEWQSYNKTAVFRNGEERYEIPIDETNKVQIPDEIFAGYWFQVGVYGSKIKENPEGDIQEIVYDHIYPSVFSNKIMISRGSQSCQNTYNYENNDWPIY